MPHKDRPSCLQRGGQPSSGTKAADLVQLGSGEKRKWHPQSCCSDPPLTCLARSIRRTPHTNTRVNCLTMRARCRHTSRAGLAQQRVGGPHGAPCKGLLPTLPASRSHPDSDTHRRANDRTAVQHSCKRTMTNAHVTSGHSEHNVRKSELLHGVWVRPTLESSSQNNRRPPDARAHERSLPRLRNLQHGRRTS